MKETINHILLQLLLYGHWKLKEVNSRSVILFKDKGKLFSIAKDRWINTPYSELEIQWTGIYYSTGCLNMYDEEVLATLKNK